MNPAFAFILTLGEAFLTLILVRFVFRLVMKGVARIRGRGPADYKPQTGD